MEQHPGSGVDEDEVWRRRVTLARCEDYIRFVRFHCGS